MRSVNMRTLAMGLAACAALAGAGCGEVARTGRSPAFLVIDTIDGATGDTSSPQFRSPLPSDVQTDGGVYNDLGRVAMRLALKDPGTIDAPTTPSSLNAVTITRYRVQYVRADGRNTPGVDVPYGFDGAMTLTVSGGQTTGIFELVRVQAKLEAPLRNMRGLGGAIAINTLAQITFYGRDQAGNDVEATGTMQVNFADWADPQ